jgi:metal-responsive CopG/Arc/MetJ family transcriptional regulator
MALDYCQVNANIDIETVKQMNRMTRDEGDVSRSAFIRKLIRQEYARRYSQPNPVITVEEALTQNSENC